MEALDQLLERESDDRASACRDALMQKNRGLDALAAVLSKATVQPPDRDINVLTRAVALDVVDAARVAATVAALRTADKRLKAIAGSDADSALKVAKLLDEALAFHGAHGDADCPVCGRSDALTGSWAESSRRESARLKEMASASAQAHRLADEALRTARQILAPPPGAPRDVCREPG